MEAWPAEALEHALDGVDLDIEPLSELSEDELVVIVSSVAARVKPLGWSFCPRTWFGRDAWHLSSTAWRS